MKRQMLQMLIILLSFYQTIKAQPFDSLKNLKSPVAKIYYSTGHEERASAIAGQLNNSYAYYANLLDYKPEVILLVLDPVDWKKFASPQLIYGMPHFSSNMKTLYVAAEDNSFWRSFLPPIDKLNPDLAQQIKTTYTNNKGEVSMQNFFDLLAIHELGHAFHLQKGIGMQRNWMGELFVNILLHTYIAEKQPDLLPAITVFPRMVIAGGISEFKYTRLKDVHEHYQEIATRHPKNYGWYQSRWHAGAADIYNAAGKDVGKKIWNALLTQQESLPDEEFTSLLEIHTHKSLSDLVRNWDLTTKK